MSHNKHRAKISVILGALVVGGMLQVVGKTVRPGRGAARPPRAAEVASLSPFPRHTAEVGHSPLARSVSEIDYARDIKPILSASCYACHGPDEQSREAGLRLDRREDAHKSAIIPGHAARSRLVMRITTGNPRRRMPPASSKKPPLTPAQIDLLRRWIDQGASFEEHWAFVPPLRPAAPLVAHRAWAHNPIDAFIAAGHQRQGLTPSPPADRRTLLRRLCFDLVGLPPTMREVDDFTSDPSPDAYEKQVDRLLASPRFGERMAVLWLDLVRYADTEGYSVDDNREVSMYRDYVIDAFNHNKPYDRLTVQSLAGDLLPGPTKEDRVASGYNRLLMTSQESCASEEERRARYAADRVRNLSSVWLGLTMGCAECHDHKFDPLTTQEFYRLAAFFADIRERGIGPQVVTRFPTPRQGAQLAEKQAEIVRLKSELARSAWALFPLLQAKSLAHALMSRVEGEVPRLQAKRDAVSRAETELATLQEEVENTLTTTSGPPRIVRVLPRGNYLDQSGKPVSPGLPRALARRHRLRAGPTRLDLARWLVSPEHPLVARVFVNHLWKIAFGKGLVRSADDFGAQGTPPTHPELLDWLAVEFVQSGWDVKTLFRLIVTSSAYRQHSIGDSGQRQRDPRNIWLARQNRFRLDAEFIRDNALAVSGLLVSEIGGRSVRPSQPDNFWSDRFTQKTYQPSEGKNLYRRGLYTFWCRNYTHPELQLFDAPSRQSCTAERVRSATPLQALALMNDPAHVEAARAFAWRIMQEAAPSRRFDHAFRLALARGASPREEELLRAIYEKHLATFRHDPQGTQAFLHIGTLALPPDVEPAELAAWASVARVILNLHETISRY